MYTTFFFRFSSIETTHALFLLVRNKMTTQGWSQSVPAHTPPMTLDPGPAAAPSLGAAPSIKFFHEVCTLFELIKRAVRHEEKLKHLTNFWVRYQSRDVYQVMRLLIPLHDTERSSYGMKESHYARLVKLIFNLPDHHEDALLLKNWRNIAGSRRSSGPVRES
jgi:hypothetical protein